MDNSYINSEEPSNHCLADLVLVKTINDYNGRNYFYLDREIFFKYEEIIIKPKYKTSDGHCRVFVTTKEGAEVPLHRILANPTGNNEVTLLNDEPFDLRMINLWVNTKGKIARSVEEKKLQARWIISIDEYLKKMVENPFR